MATRITFVSGSNPLQADGVEFVQGGKKYKVTVSKEVILSTGKTRMIPPIPVSFVRRLPFATGAFQTPQLLELSGIGNKEILSKHGIETLIDNPAVGENLREWSLQLANVG